jgi:hypothetical protein
VLGSKVAPHTSEVSAIQASIRHTWQARRLRRTVGYRRYEGLDAAAALVRLYGSLRLFVNFFQPSFKLAGKVRDGAKVTKKYHPPATPYQRLLADARTNEEVRRRVTAIHATLNPVQLLQTIRTCQQELVEIADRPTSGEAMPPTAPTTEQFLAGLRTAWQEGEVRPTSKPKEKARRGRRRPDPFVTVTALMRGWFEAEPWRTSRELFERLQAEQPGVYPDGQLRTLQRRLKDWRHTLAHKMVFGVATSGEMPGQASLHSPDTVGVTRFRDVTLRNGCADARSSTGGRVPRCSLRGRSGARHPRHARATEHAARGSAPPIPSIARRGSGGARSGRESRLADRTGKPVWVAPRRAAQQNPCNRLTN